jgi:ATP/ADP translocase/HEAT repeat protein
MPTTRDGNPLTRFLRLEPGEGGLTLALAVLMATLFGGYTVAKVLRDSLFISEFGAKNLPWGYVAVAVASIAFVALESRVTLRLARAQATALGQTVAIAFAVLFALLYHWNRHWTAGAFYVWAGSQALMILSYFWLLALELWDARRAQAILPLFSGAGLVGGVLGGAFANWAVGRVGISGLLWTLVGLLVLARAITLLLDRQLPGRPFLAHAGSGTSPLEILRHSPFLRYLAATLALSVVVSTLVDFQFKYAAQQAYPDSHRLTSFLGLFYAGLNGLALLVQFGAAGWIVRRTGVFFSTLPQPVSVLVFATWIVFSPIFGVIVALRYVQGVLFQTLGKSAFELYFMAVRPHERQKVKPALDTLVERLADAAAGIALIAVLHAIGVDMRVVAGLTVLVSLAWLIMLVQLQRRYVRTFRDSLARHADGDTITSEGLKLPEARRTLLAALGSDDDLQVVTALGLVARARHKDVERAAATALDRPANEVRAAAVRALDAIASTGHDEKIEPFLAEPDPGLRRAAVAWLLSRGHDPVGIARRLLDGDDAELRTLTLDTLVDRRRLLPGAITLEWIDALMARGDEQELVAAALALALVGGKEADERLAQLLEHPAQDVRRAALVTATRRPVPALQEKLVTMLSDGELASEAREAAAALGQTVIPRLVPLLDGSQGGSARRAACDALGRIGGRSAVATLLTVVRGGDPDARFDALRALNRIRARSPRGLVKKTHALRLWQREIEEYRDHLLPGLILEEATDPRIRLLEASYLEAADRALDRACRALACYYRPEPFRSVYHYLKSPASPKTAGRALEFLSHLLPRRNFAPLRQVFEETKVAEETAGPPNDGQVAGCIERAFGMGDAWLRACAVRAAQALDGRVTFDFTPRSPESPLVLEELAVTHAVRPAGKEGP